MSTIKRYQTALWLAALAAAMLFGHTLAHSAETKPSAGVTGKDLLVSCTSHDVMQSRYCLAFVRAVGDMVELWHDVSPSMLDICIASKVTADELRDVGIAYIKANPKTRHMAGAYLLTDAFSKAYRCAADDDGEAAADEDNKPVTSNKKEKGA